QADGAAAFARQVDSYRADIVGPPPSADIRRLTHFLAHRLIKNVEDRVGTQFQDLDLAAIRHHREDAFPAQRISLPYRLAAYTQCSAFDCAAAGGGAYKNALQ